MKKPENKKTEFLSVRLPGATKSKLELIAEENDRSLSWIVAKILNDYVNNSAKGPKI